MKIQTLSLLVIFSSVVIQAFSKPIVLTDTTERFEWKNGYCQVYFDSIHSKTFSEIREISKQGKFQTVSSDLPRLHSSNKELWTSVHVEYTGDAAKAFLIELYDFHIDVYDIYVLKGDSIFLHAVGGDSFPFDHRKIKHKNYLHEVHFEPNTAYTIYIRIEGKQSITAFGLLRTNQDLIYYSNKEYMLLSIFYGFLLLMALYCIIISIFTLQKTYLYFAINIFSVSLYSLSNDGLGFQYIWYNHVNFNEYVQSLSIALFSITSLLYSASFLQLQKRSKNYWITVRTLLYLRITLYILGFIFYEPIIYRFEIDIFILIVIFFIAVKSYSKNYTPARFFIAAYTVLFIGFTTHILMVLGYINNTFFTVYALNFGTVFQLFIFSFALADQVRMVISETRMAQFDLISQLKENDLLKDTITKELEDKVRERTQELEFKNQQLDAFVYKASHDIKGPLKSIIGLAKLGILDIDDADAREYFQHIEKSSIRLDTLVADLLQVSKINNNVVQDTQIDFQKIIDEVQFSLSNIIDFEKFKIVINVKQDRDFYSDRNMIYSIFQNLIENAFTYRDREKVSSFIKIRIEIDKQKTVFEFIDNGIGINKDLKDKVFDMFYRASDISGGSGLGLYLVKMAVNKIGGRINVESKMKKGTTFTIVI